MSFYLGMTCENVTLKGDKGTPITAYVAKPSGPGPFPGVVLVHHLPETTRRFAHHGYLAIWRHFRRPDARRYRGRSEVDARAVSIQNGKVGIFGSCSAPSARTLAATSSGFPWPARP